MNPLDQKLLSLLRQNARYSIAYLAQKLNVSRATITNHIKHLEDTGVIVGYRVQLRPDAETDAIIAWTGIAVEGNSTLKVVAQLLGEPAVVSLHDTNGRWDLLAELHAENLTELGNALERIRLIKDISNTETSIHLKSYR